MATLGKTSVGSEYWSVSADVAHFFTATATETGYVSSITFNGANSFGHTSYLKPVIYSNNSIITNGIGNSVVGRSWGDGFGWTTATYTTKPLITSGVSYRIAIISDSADYNLRYDEETLTADYGFDDYTTPDGLTGVGTLDNEYSIYLTYTITGPSGITKIEGITPGKIEGVSWEDITDIN